MRRWKPYFTEEVKEEVWNLLVQNDIIDSNGKVKFQGANNENPKGLLDLEIPIENLEKNSILFDQMLKIAYNGSFGSNLIKRIIHRTESKYWEFKETLGMWNVSNSSKIKRQVKFCETVALFANNCGGIIIIGITDKIPREIIGVSDIEDKLKSIRIVLNKYIEWQEKFFELVEVILDDDNKKKRCIAVVIAQTKASYFSKR